MAETTSAPSAADTEVVWDDVPQIVEPLYGINESPKRAWETLLYAWHRSRYIYDHVITALHVQTFIYMTSTVFLVLAAIQPSLTGWLVLFGNLALVVYLYKQLRVTYGTGRFMAMMRTFILLISSFIVLVILLGLLIAVSFALT